MRVQKLFIIVAFVLVSLRSTCAERSIDTSRTTLKPQSEEFRLRLKHLHTGESIDVVFRRGDNYLLGPIALLNHFLRDYRTGDDAHYDPKEFDLLHAILAKLHQPNAFIEIICGYRTPTTNEFLRTRSAVTGVAENSQHMQSKAIDIRIPGVSTARLRDVALSLGMGGVGYYPSSHFVHVDVGPVRQWAFGVKNRVLTARSHEAIYHKRHVEG